jgi:hypothetical protein
VRLNAQIHNAYYVNHDEFARTLLEDAKQMHQQVYSAQPSPTDFQSHSVSPVSPVYHSTLNSNNNTNQNQARDHNNGHNQSQVPSPAQSQSQNQGHYPAQGNHHAYHQREMYDAAPPAYGHHNGQDMMHYPFKGEYMTTSPQSSSLQHWAGNPQDHANYPMAENGYPAQAPGLGHVIVNAPQNQYYTPEAALRGIAADDRGLQETWTSFMYQVGSPRQFLQD